ncbi:hypothetical protein CLLI_20310 [Clostridium liquoris]|uniref:RAMP superfamily protein n=1 Tax=Clostridium liquoris TaxID=1289519 RepID=A0A2T0B247_9CLOT|nr:hypothetical protein [Clostridium liquoris]PRR77936.1 hypothetical protein CLLI_20310 [Clostridium liquoris]
MTKFIVTLKQNNPLIHFQGDQSGATIRGTEFKPKLDKFLIKNAFLGNFELYKQYLVGYKVGRTKDDFKDKEAFNYKIKFYNMKNLQSKRKQDKYKLKFDTVQVEIFSFYKNLLDIIAKNLPEFLEKNNFGSGQSKGHNGSFCINSDNEFILDGEKFYFNNVNKKEQSVKNKEHIKKKEDKLNLEGYLDPSILEKLKELRNSLE